MAIFDAWRFLVKSEEQYRAEKVLADRLGWKHIYSVKWIVCSLLVSRLVASEVDEAIVVYSQSRAVMEELLKVERAIDSEKREWELKQQGISDLLELYQQELELISEELESAGSSLEKMNEELESVKASVAAFQQAREVLVGRIDQQRGRLFKLYGMFPEPLQQQLLGEKDNLLNDALVLKDKVASVVRVLKAADKFNRIVSYSEEIHEIDGEERQLRVLYVGLAGAYYVSGSTSGTGKPSQEGWIWKSGNTLQESIARAIAVFQKTARPQLVNLPVEVQSK
ncbi:MAG: DUF3450 family protein [Rubritalea sp.]|uniref:DUF3450 family protein n=1 Tax=Rubritalea sp. TaxID=2109375 RepID=UPI00324205BC